MHVRRYAGRALEWRLDRIGAATYAILATGIGRDDGDNLAVVTVHISHVVCQCSAAGRSERGDARE